jgi:NTE family protein
MASGRLSTGQSMKINLVLSGGAARGAFHLGAIEALLDMGYEIAAISGSSIGAIIGVSFAAGVSPREQLALYKSKEFRKVFRFYSFRKGLIKIDKEKPIIKKLVPIERLEDLKIETTITTIDLQSGKIVRFSKGDAVKLAVASGSIAPIFKPVKYEAFSLVDGGVMDNLPASVFKESDLPIVAVDLHPMQEGFKNSSLGILKRVLFLSWRASVEHQIGSCDYYISNKKLSTYPLFRLKKLDELFELGYKETRATLEQ